MCIKSGKFWSIAIIGSYISHIISLALEDGIFEKSNCVVPDKGVEFTRAPESIENPISTSRNLLCNVNEMSNKPGVDDIVNKQSEKCSLLMSTFRESWENLLSYMRRHSLVPLLLAGAFFVIILLQASYTSLSFLCTTDKYLASGIRIISILLAVGVFMLHSCIQTVSILIQFCFPVF